MSSTYNRIVPYILASKKDVENRQIIQRQRVELSVIKCQIEIAAWFLDEAISRMERK